MEPYLIDLREQEDINICGNTLTLARFEDVETSIERLWRSPRGINLDAPFDLYWVNQIAYNNFLMGSGMFREAQRHRGLREVILNTDQARPYVTWLNQTYPLPHFPKFIVPLTQLNLLYYTMTIHDLAGRDGICFRGVAAPYNRAISQDEREEGIFMTWRVIEGEYQNEEILIYSREVRRNVGHTDVPRHRWIARINRPMTEENLAGEPVMHSTFSPRDAVHRLGYLSRDRLEGPLNRLMARLIAAYHNGRSQIAFPWANHIPIPDCLIWPDDFNPFAISAGDLPTLNPTNNDPL